MKRLLAVLCLVLAGCVGIPDTVEPVKNFKLQRYLGTWYEIARLDHPKNGSWARSSVRLAGCLARREEAAGEAPARTSNAARQPPSRAIRRVADSLAG